MKQKKDILFLCQFFYPEYISSAQLPYETVQSLINSGFSVGVLCGYPQEYYHGDPVPAVEEKDGIYIHRLRYIQTGRKGFIGRIVNYFSFTLAVLLHLFEIGRYRAVAVYSNPPIAPWIASFASFVFGTKLVFICYDAYPEVATRMGALREKSMIYNLMNHINKVVFKRTERVVALSSEMKEFLCENRCIQQDRIQVIPNWSDDLLTGQRVADNPIKAGLQGKYVVSYFGNMGTAQDMQTIMDAIRILKDQPNIHFLFAGHGNKKADIQRMLEKEAISNVTMMDFLQGEEFRCALDATDAALVCLEKGLRGICVPSKTYTYMMYALPLLGIMEDGDIVSDIEAGAGIRVRNEQAALLADAILELASDPEKSRAMGRRSRELFEEKYTRAICTEQYVQMFRSILEH